MSKKLRKELARLQEIANFACEQAQKEKDRFQNDAINWGDLGCITAEYVFDVDGDEHYRVLIEEASPTSAELQRFVRRHFQALGISDVEVATEW